jgi:hypothetical protein
MSLTKTNYYIIETPSITDISYLYTYNYDINIKKTNNLNYNNYDNNSCTIMYSDIVLYNPNPAVNIYQGIQLSKCTGTYNTNNLPYTIFELTKFVSQKFIKFINDLQLVNRCNRYGSSNDAIPAECSNTFNNYDSKNNINQQMRNVQNNLFPSYTSEYLPVKIKHLQQQYNDIKNLTDRLNTIITTLQNDPTIRATDIETIVNENKRLLKFRSDLDMKLGEIYEYSNSDIVKSQHELNNTIYSGVLLTVLASSLAYIFFIKMR